MPDTTPGGNRNGMQGKPRPPAAAWNGTQGDMPVLSAGGQRRYVERLGYPSTGAEVNGLPRVAGRPRRQRPDPGQAEGRAAQATRPRSEQNGISTQRRISPVRLDRTAPREARMQRHLPPQGQGAEPIPAQGEGTPAQGGLSPTDEAPHDATASSARSARRKARKARTREPGRTSSRAAQPKRTEHRGERPRRQSQAKRSESDATEQEREWNTGHLLG